MCDFYNNPPKNVEDISTYLRSWLQEVDEGPLKVYKTRRFCIKGYCTHRCILKECKTFHYCEDSYPEWWYSSRNYTTSTQCNYCGIYAVKFPNEKGPCEICSTDKYLIETECNHRFCLDCLIHMNGTDDGRTDSPCPYCRKNVEHNPLIV